VLKRKDGTLFDAQLESAPVQFNGQPALNSILTDITERRQFEQERETASLELEGKIKERTAELLRAEQELQTAPLVRAKGHDGFPREIVLRQKDPDRSGMSICLSSFLTILRMVEKSSTTRVFIVLCLSAPPGGIGEIAGKSLDIEVRWAVVFW
jgi:hypothetical protein